MDTTATGDTFIGTFISKFNMNDLNLTDAIDYANKVASVTVQRSGAQASIPLAKKVQ